MKHRVLVADALSSAGIELLRATEGFDVTVETSLKPDQLAACIGEYDALVVRSATKVTAATLERPGRLRVIGRAGTGVDNIDLAAATRAGVVVINTPGGNSVAAAELTFSLILALARNVSQANADLRAGRWERKRYMGVELAGKVLGIVGMGRIGREVARRAQAFRMEVVGYDPFVSSQVAGDSGIESLSLEALVERSDFVSLHLPLGPDTEHMIDAALLGRFKPEAYLVNCARGGLIDEEALVEALDAKLLAGAALDVFEEEPPQNERLVQHPRVVCTPHLGASTREAQERVGTEIAEKIRDYLESGMILDAVNFPSIPKESFAVLGPVMDLAERMGSFLAQVTEGGVRKLNVCSFGSLSQHSLRPIAMSAAKGLLSRAMGRSVSHVNALSLAGERGVAVEESRSNETSPFAGLLRLTLTTDRGETTVAGTLLGPGHARLVEVDGVAVECHPGGHMLFFRNRDVPGVVGRIGTILGRSGVNIAGIQLGRAGNGGFAISIINVDSEVPGEALAEIGRHDDVVVVRSLYV